MPTHVMLCRPQCERRPELAVQLREGIEACGGRVLPVPCLRLCITCQGSAVALINGRPFSADDAAGLIEQLRPVIAEEADSTES